MTQNIDIEFLFLDLSGCSRCINTGENLEAGIEAAKGVLQEQGDFTFRVHKTLVESLAQAEALRFFSSPTIRVNGWDIALEAKESPCGDGCGACGCLETTECRVWLYDGEEHLEAPAPMIRDAILEAVARSNSLAEPSPSAPAAFEVPDNLKAFFANKNPEPPQDQAACCGPKKLEDCCAPTEKAACCGPSEAPAACGC